MYKRLELHNHTTESDSSITYLELAEHMEKNGADAFALTDHNTISGHPKMKKLLKNSTYQTQCIYGMEYTTYYGHILCFDLTEYVPWDSIHFHKPELLFQAVKEKGGIPGIAHPFSFGAPFARGCRFEMTVHDFTCVDFIEVFNNPEPLHEVNEKGLLWWESLVLDGHNLAATCGMDLHGKWTLEGQYATYIEGKQEGDITKELHRAIKKQQTWVSRGPLLLWEISKSERTITFSILDTQKPGGILNKTLPYYLTLRTLEGSMEKEFPCESKIKISYEEIETFAGKGSCRIIPKLYEEKIEIENLSCLSPVIEIEI